MNFLAHLWLADRSKTSLPGSVLGDVVRGSDLSAYPADIEQGIRLHRRVDAATDRHPSIVKLRSEYARGERRYAGIVLDLAADRALAQEWPAIGGGESLESFTARCGQAVAVAGPWFVLGGGHAPNASGFTELLRSYGTDAGIERAIRRTAVRLRDPDALIDAGRRWTDSAAALQPVIGPLLEDLLAVMRQGMA